MTSLCAALIGGAAGVVCETLGYPSWVMFLVWTSYTLFGKTLRAGVKMYASFCAGTLCGFTVRGLEAALDPTVGALSTFVAVGLAIFLLSLLEDDPPLNDVPAYFLGAIAFFATGSDPSRAAFVSLVVAGGFGLLIGWLTVTSQTRVARLLPRRVQGGGTS